MACRVALSEIRRYLAACDEDESIALGVFVEGIGAEVAQWMDRLQEIDDPCRDRVPVPCESVDSPA